MAGAKNGFSHYGGLLTERFGTKGESYRLPDSPYQDKVKEDFDVLEVLRKFPNSIFSQCFMFSVSY